MFYCLACAIPHNNKDHNALMEEILESKKENRGVLAPNKVPKQIDRRSITEILEPMEGEG